MATLQIRRPYTAEELLEPASSSAGAVGGGVAPRAAPGAAPAAPVKPAANYGERQGGFVNLSRYLDANQAQGQRMAGKVLGDIEKTGRGAQGAAQPRAAYSLPEGILPASLSGVGGVALDDPMGRARKAGAAAEKAQLGSTLGGRQELVEGAYGKGSSGEGRLDAALLGGAAGNRFVDLSKHYQGLQGMAQAQAARLGEGNPTAALKGDGLDEAAQRATIKAGNVSAGADGAAGGAQAARAKADKALAALQATRARSPRSEAVSKASEAYRKAEEEARRAESAAQQFKARAAGF